MKWGDNGMRVRAVTPAELAENQQKSGLILWGCLASLFAIGCGLGTTVGLLLGRLVH